MPIPLVERSEREIARKIRRRVRGVAGVADCREVSMGFTRKKPYVHFHVGLIGNPSFEDSHRICSNIETEVRGLVPNARVVIHSEPNETQDMKDVWRIVGKTAEGEPGSRGVQNIHLGKKDGRLGIDFDVLVGSQVIGQRAHELEVQIETKLKAAEPRISEVVVHQESVSELVLSEQSGHGTEVRWYLEHVAKRFPEALQLRPPAIQRMGDRFSVLMRVSIPGTSPERAREIKNKLQAAIKGGFPEISRADIIEEQTDLGGTKGRVPAADLP
jgi:divalent metal cation (Fe/Co/Zn/Cd) transporter